MGCLAALAAGAHAAEGRILEEDLTRLRHESWRETWPDAVGKMEVREVTAPLWNDVLQSVLDRDSRVHLPKRETPYYLDGPIRLRSGQQLTADRDTEIRLKPGTNTCMVRNEHVQGSAQEPMREDEAPSDTDIRVEGGIWTTLANGDPAANGNRRGAHAKAAPLPGMHGVLLFNHAKRVTVRNVTIRQSQAFGVHLSQVEDFLVEGVTLDRHRRDGVHVNGPARSGVIRQVRGDSHDDNVSLAAWDWQGYAPSYGKIQDILVEDVTGAPLEKQAADAIRLLPGVKRFANGVTVACPIENITLRNITDIRDFKLYDQPNLEAGRDKDFSVEMGSLKNIRFENLRFTRPGSLQVHANTEGLHVSEVRLEHAVRDDHALIEIGPKSAVYKHGSTDPEKWVEVFSPDRDCTVRHLSLSGVVLSNGRVETPANAERWVKIIEMQPNADYPRTVPKGGVGKGIWIR